MKRDMRKYILRKLVELIFTLLFVTLLSFLLMRLSSVDPATAYAKRMIGNPTAEQIEKIRIQLGFDKPLLVQYGRWVWDLLHFDLGVSLANGHDVWTDIATAFPKTLGIVALASIFQVVFIVIVSCIAFLLPWKLPKKAVRLLCILGVSIPSFYLATVYLDYFAVQKSFYSRKQHYRFCRSQWRRQVYHYEADCGILGCNKRNCQVRRNRYSQNSVVTAYG